MASRIVIPKIPITQNGGTLLNIRHVDTSPTTPFKKYIQPGRQHDLQTLDVTKQVSFDQMTAQVGDQPINCFIFNFSIPHNRLWDFDTAAKCLDGERQKVLIS
jgi:hypothetical protein